MNSAISTLNRVTLFRRSFSTHTTKNYLKSIETHIKALSNLPISTDSTIHKKELRRVLIELTKDLHHIRKTASVSPVHSQDIPTLLTASSLLVREIPTNNPPICSLMLNAGSLILEALEVHPDVMLSKANYADEKFFKELNSGIEKAQKLKTLSPEDIFTLGRIKGTVQLLDSTSFPEKIKLNDRMTQAAFLADTFSSQILKITGPILPESFQWISSIPGVLTGTRLAFLMASDLNHQAHKNRIYPTFFSWQKRVIDFNVDYFNQHPSRPIYGHLRDSKMYFGSPLQYRSMELVAEEDHGTPEGVQKLENLIMQTRQSPFSMSNLIDWKSIREGASGSVSAFLNNQSFNIPSEYYGARILRELSLSHPLQAQYKHLLIKLSQAQPTVKAELEFPKVSRQLSISLSAQVPDESKDSEIVNLVTYCTEKTKEGLNQAWENMSEGYYEKAQSQLLSLLKGFSTEEIASPIPSLDLQVIVLTISRNMIVLAQKEQLFGSKFLNEFCRLSAHVFPVFESEPQTLFNRAVNFHTSGHFLKAYDEWILLKETLSSQDSEHDFLSILSHHCVQKSSEHSASMTDSCIEFITSSLRSKLTEVVGERTHTNKWAEKLMRIFFQLKEGHVFKARDLIVTYKETVSHRRELSEDQKQAIHGYLEKFQELQEQFQTFLEDNQIGQVREESLLKEVKTYLGVDSMPESNKVWHKHCFKLVHNLSLFLSLETQRLDRLFEESAPITFTPLNLLRGFYQPKDRALLENKTKQEILHDLLTKFESLSTSNSQDASLFVNASRWCIAYLPPQISFTLTSEIFNTVQPPPPSTKMWLTMHYITGMILDGRLSELIHVCKKEKEAIETHPFSIPNAMLYPQIQESFNTLISELTDHIHTRLSTHPTQLHRNPAALMDKLHDSPSLDTLCSLIDELNLSLVGAHYQLLTMAMIVDSILNKKPLHAERAFRYLNTLENTSTRQSNAVILRKTIRRLLFLDSIKQEGHFIDPLRQALYVKNIRKFSQSEHYYVNLILETQSEIPRYRLNLHHEENVWRKISKLGSNDTHMRTVLCTHLLNLADHYAFDTVNEEKASVYYTKVMETTQSTQRPHHLRHLSIIHYYRAYSGIHGPDEGKAWLINELETTPYGKLSIDIMRYFYANQRYNILTEIGQKILEKDKEVSFLSPRYRREIKEYLEIAHINAGGSCTQLKTMVEAPLSSGKPLNGSFRTLLDLEESHQQRLYYLNQIMIFYPQDSDSRLLLVLESLKEFNHRFGNQGTDAHMDSGHRKNEGQKLIYFLRKHFDILNKQLEGHFNHKITDLKSKLLVLKRLPSQSDDCPALIQDVENFYVDYKKLIETLEKELNF